MGIKLSGSFRALNLMLGERLLVVPHSVDKHKFLVVTIRFPNIQATFMLIEIISGSPFSDLCTLKNRPLSLIHI